MTAAVTLHATTVALGGRAVLLTGPSGAGKSDLALRLIDRGATLVSDDQTMVIRRDRRLFAAAVCIGACVVGGWWATGLAGHDPFGTERAASFSFARPIGDTALYAMLASGMKPDFAVGSVAGNVVRVL